MADTDPDIGSDPEEQGAFDGTGPPDVLTSRKASEEVPYQKGEMRVVDWIYGLFDEAERGKKDQCDPDGWPDDLAAYWGSGWPTALPTYKPRVTVNTIKSLLLQDLSDLTDSRLKIYVQKDKRTTVRDQQVEDSIQTYWTDKFCDLTMLLAALDAMIYPLGFIQTGWDMFAEQGQGEVTFTHRDPKSVFPDPNATNDDELRYMILKDVLDVVEIRRDWPETGYRVRPEEEFSVRSGDKKDLSDRGLSGYTGPLYSKVGMSGVPGYVTARAGVLTTVVDDDETVREIHDIGGMLKRTTRYRYPHKHMIQVANNRVLYDEDCPYWYAPMVTRVMLQPAVHAYWPQNSLVQEFSEIQNTANKLDSLVAENMLRLNQGLIFADADSGINPQRWAPIPGLITLVKPGTSQSIRFFAGTPMDPSMVNGGERLRGYIRDTMGFPPSRTGAGTHGNVAAELAETEISQAMGLTRLRGRLMYQSVQRAVRMLFARMAQFYTTPRHLPYVDDGQLKSIKWEPVPEPNQYVVHVDPASFQVRSKTMIQRVALALAKMGKMPTGRLLKILEFPDADRIAAELTEELKLIVAAKQAQKEQKRRGG